MWETKQKEIVSTVHLPEFGNVIVFHSFENLNLLTVFHVSGKPDCQIWWNKKKENKRNQKRQIEKEKQKRIERKSEVSRKTRKRRRERRREGGQERRKRKS